MNSILVLEVQGNAETVYNYGWTIAYYQAYNIRSAAGGVRWRCTGVGSLDRTEYQVVTEWTGVSSTGVSSLNTPTPGHTFHLGLVDILALTFCHQYTMYLASSLAQF